MRSFLLCLTPYPVKKTMKPSYSKLKSHHYSSNENARNFVDAKLLYSEIGYSRASLLRQNRAYRNTCAVRMSLALLKAGVPFAARSLGVSSSKLPAADLIVLVV